MFRYTPFTALRETLVWVIAIIFLIPFYFLVTTALKSDAEVLSTNSSTPPSVPDFSNFVAGDHRTGQLERGHGPDQQPDHYRRHDGAAWYCSGR